LGFRKPFVNGVLSSQAQSEMRVERLQRTVERFLQTKVLAAVEASGKKRFTEGE